MESMMSFTRLFRAVALLAFGLTSAQSQVPVFQGHVYDSNHKPVVGATASIGPAGRSSSGTDSTGHFSIQPAPSVKVGDPVTLKIDKDGFLPYLQHLDYTGSSQVVTLPAESPARRPPTTNPPAQHGGQPQPPTAGTNSPAQPAVPLWSQTGDQIIDLVQQRLNSLPSDATDALTTSILRGLFDAPIFGSVGEELPEDALYRFCKTERILTHYQLGFHAPELRTAAATASQNLIYLQDIFGDLYGPAFLAKEYCRNLGARPRSDYESSLGQPLKPTSSLDTVKAQHVINMMLTTLYAVGLSSHAPPAPPPPPPATDSGAKFQVQIDSARLNDWLEQGNKGGNQYWLKSVWLSVDTDERQIAKDLAFDADVPQVDQSFTLTKGRHKFRFRLEFDVKHLRTHEKFTTDRLGDFEVDNDAVLTPFLTVKAGEITQYLLLKQSDPIPNRTAP
jgi:hypothetical protein